MTDCGKHIEVASVPPMKGWRCTARRVHHLAQGHQSTGCVRQGGGSLARQHPKLVGRACATVIDLMLWLGTVAVGWESVPPQNRPIPETDHRLVRHRGSFGRLLDGDEGVVQL